MIAKGEFVGTVVGLKEEVVKGKSIEGVSDLDGKGLALVGTCIVGIFVERGAEMARSIGGG